MTYPLLNRKFVSGRWLAVMMLGWVGLISACSSEGTTTILENGQTLSIDLPDVLTRAVDNGTLEAPNLRPVVTLSNGATVGTTLVDDNRWSGTINLEIDAVYTVTVTWIERYLDQDLPLTRRSLDLAVGGDGSAEEVTGSRTDYSDQGLDFDNDGASNLEERLSGEDPLQGEATDNPATGEEPIEGGIDVSPMVSVSLPDALVPALLSGALNIDDLRPVVTVSNGDTVDMTPIGNNDWTGSFNVTTAGVYTITTIWVEDYLGMDLSLARRTVDLAIGEDSSVVQSAATGYDIDFDDDNDGPSNLSERVNGTDPLTNDAQAPASELVDALDGTQNSDTQNFQPTLDDLLSDQDATASNAATDTGTSTLIENGQAADTTTSLRVTADVIVPRISASDAPGIDGLNVTADSQNRLTGEWAQAVQSDISGAALAIDHLMIDIDAEPDGNIPHRRWAAMHDGRYLYVVVLVDDDGYRVRDSGAALYDDDSLELYLDADNSKSTSYDNNDFHRLFPLRAPGGNESSKVSVNSGDVPGPNSSATPLPIDFATGPGVGPDGLRRANYEQDVYELRIPLQSAGISSDMPFGFELQVNDDDDGVARDAKWGWMHPVRTTSDIDETVLNPSLMGTLMLE